MHNKILRGLVPLFFCEFCTKNTHFIHKIFHLLCNNRNMELIRQLEKIIDEMLDIKEKILDNLFKGNNENGNQS